MTREEAIEWINSLVETMINETHGSFPDPEYKDEVYEALDMAIKALKQELILDKIRAEVEKKHERAKQLSFVLQMGAYIDCLQIIDKCKAESEVKN